MKYRFGIAEVIAGIMGAFLFIALHMVLTGFLPQGSIWCCDRMELVIVILIAALFGPYAALVSAIVGCFCCSFIGGVPIDFLRTCSLGFFAVFIGLYAQKFGVREGMFTPDNIIEFNILQMLMNLIVFVFLIPLFSFLLKGNLIYYSIEEGIEVMLYNIILIGVLDSILMQIINMVCRRRDKSSTDHRESFFMKLISK